ncbi:MAG: PIG-L deacetylase family protein [Acidimicrobiales bacterium]
MITAGALRPTAKRAAKTALSTAKAPAHPLLRRWLLGRGVDITETAAAQSCLVVAPHPDDETIGPGALIARKRAAGAAVRVAVVTDGRFSHRSSVLSPAELGAVREAESRAACAELGVAPSEVRFLGFMENALGADLFAVAAALRQEILDTAPEQILVVSDLDWHPDHKAVHQALLCAARDCAFDGEILAFPVWFWAEGPWRSRPGANLAAAARDFVVHPVQARRIPPPRLVSTAGFAEQKRRAFECYASQTTNLTGEPGWAQFDPAWIEPFLAPAEIFLPVRTGW